MDDLISRQAAIDMIHSTFSKSLARQRAEECINKVPAVQDKFEYHYDHTDCVWHGNRCPSTCAQYRDGWNDAMNYIFRDGKGYRPYRRDKKYE